MVESTDVKQSRKDHSSALILKSTTTNEEAIEEVVHLDSLPYIDYLHPDYETYALSLIENEMQKDDPTKLHTQCDRYKIRPSNDNCFLKNALVSQQEYKELESRNGEPRRDNTALFQKIIQEPRKLGQISTEATSSLKIEIEKLRHDNVNLQLQQIFESGQWRLYNQSLEQFSNKYQSIVQEQKRKIDDINGVRASKQEAIYERLNKGHMKWADLVYKHCKLAMATNKLEPDVKRRRKELGISGAKDEADPDAS